MLKWTKATLLVYLVEDMSGPRVDNGKGWLVVPAAHTNLEEKPIEPILDGDGKIFVSIVSYRGTLFVLVRAFK